MSEESSPDLEVARLAHDVIVSGKYTAPILQPAANVLIKLFTEATNEEIVTPEEGDTQDG